MATEASSIVYRVKAAFDKLAAGTPRNSTTVNLLAAWSTAFPEKTNAPSVLEVIGHLSRSVRLLQSQINSSTMLRAGAKSSATSIVDGLARLLSTGMLLQAVSNVSANYSDHNLGVLEGIGVALSLEFPEVEVDDSAAQDFLSQINDLNSEIQSSDFNPDLKTTFGSYLGFLKWSLENKDTMSSAMVRDTAASVLMSVYEAHSLTMAQPESPERTVRLSILERAQLLAMQVASAAFKIDVFGHGLLEFARDAGKLLLPAAH